MGWRANSPNFVHDLDVNRVERLYAVHCQFPFEVLVGLLVANRSAFYMVAPRYEHDIEQSFDKLKVEKQNLLLKCHSTDAITGYSPFLFDTLNKFNRIMLTILEHRFHIQSVSGTCLIIRTPFQVVGQFSSTHFINNAWILFIDCI